jgi:DNA-binding MarR family transcriptional regulator
MLPVKGGRAVETDKLLKLDQQFCFAAYAVARSVAQAYDPLLAPLDLTYPQYLVMLVLWERDDVSLKTLGERLRLDSGTLTPLVKRLEAKGLLTRTRSNADERAIKIALTAEGRKLRRKAASIPEGLVCRMNMPTAKLLKLRDDLKDVLNAMDAVSG